MNKEKKTHKLLLRRGKKIDVVFWFQGCGWDLRWLLQKKRKTDYSLKLLLHKFYRFTHKTILKNLLFSFFRFQWSLQFAEIKTSSILCFISNNSILFLDNAKNFIVKQNKKKELSSCLSLLALIIIQINNFNKKNEKLFCQ